MSETSHPVTQSGNGVCAWQSGERRLLADCRVFTVHEEVFHHPQRGQSHPFYVIDSKDWVIVLPWTRDDELVLVEQFRFGQKGFSLELPGGVLEAEEDPVTGGCRELLEETGYRASRADYLGFVYPNPAIQTNRCHFVLAKDCAPAQSVAWDQHEELHVGVHPVDRVLSWAREGHIRHALALNALFLFEPIRKSHSDGKIS